VDIKIICKYVIDSLAQGVILCHNHPSGNLKPSRTDEVMTEKLANALKLMDSKLFDHIIITKDSHYSMQENGGI
jgi:DNA repair protein RadC